MIAGFSKATTLYLAPLLTLTAVILSLLTLISPTLVLRSNALLVVSPPISADGSQPLPGPSLLLGILGSCSRSDGVAAINCTLSSFSPIYDVSALPPSAPTLLLTAPILGVPIFVAVSFTFTVLFFLSFTLVSFRHKMGEKLTATLDKPVVQSLSAWIGVFGFLIGLVCFLIMRMWFGKAVRDFNAMIQQTDVKLSAKIGDAFTMAWIAFAFYAVPLVISLSKLNVKATK